MNMENMYPEHEKDLLTLHESISPRLKTLKNKINIIAERGRKKGMERWEMVRLHNAWGSIDEAQEQLRLILEGNGIRDTSGWSR